MADKPGPLGVYFTNPPSGGKKPPLAGIRAYIAYIVYGMAALGAVKLASMIAEWLT